MQKHDDRMTRQEPLHTPCKPSGMQISLCLWPTTTCLTQEEDQRERPYPFQDDKSAVEIDHVSSLLVKVDVLLKEQRAHPHSG